MARTLPKAVKVWVAANLLAIEFDNGQNTVYAITFLLINISLLGHYQKARKDVDY